MPSCAAPKPRDLPSQLISSDSESFPYVTRGGLKLRGALDTFKLSPEGKVALDIGSSHGGFTDCLLQAGATRVWCVDVGYGLLDYKLRNDPRVKLMERTNIRHLEPSQITEPIDFVTIDVAFISLSKVWPALLPLLEPGVPILALVKPQFEGTPKEAPGGTIKDEETRAAILERVKQSVLGIGLTLHGVFDSTITGKRSGNQETFFHLSIPTP